MRLGRRHTNHWLSPLRKALRDIRNTGEVLEADGHALVEMPEALIRIDYCLEGFVRMILRALPNANVSALNNVRQKLSDDEPLTIQELDAALSEINAIEPQIARLSVDAIKSAASVEEIAIEMELAGVVA